MQYFSLAIFRLAKATSVAVAVFWHRGRGVGLQVLEVLLRTCRPWKKHHEHRGAILLLADPVHGEATVLLDAALPVRYLAHRVLVTTPEPTLCRYYHNLVVSKVTTVRRATLTAHNNLLPLILLVRLEEFCKIYLAWVPGV